MYLSPRQHVAPICAGKKEELEKAPFPKPHHITVLSPDYLVAIAGVVPRRTQSLLQCRRCLRQSGTLFSYVFAFLRSASAKKQKRKIIWELPESKRPPTGATGKRRSARRGRDRWSMVARTGRV